MLFSQIRCKNNNISTAFTLFTWLKLVNKTDISLFSCTFFRKSKPKLHFFVSSASEAQPTLKKPMFENSKTIDNLQALLAEMKRYAELQKDYIKLDIAHKLTVLLSTLILTFILAGLGLIALLYLSFTLAYMLEGYVGGLMNSYAIITGLVVVACILIYLCRQRIIIQPLTRFLTNLMLDEQ